MTAPASSHGGQETAAAGQDVLDWCLLQQLLHSGQWAQRGSLHLLAGGSDALLPACYHTCDRVLCQVSGRQRLLLLPPDQAFKGLYPYPVHHPYDHYSAVDLEEPELEHFPEAAKVRQAVFKLSLRVSMIVFIYADMIHYIVILL